ncbi:cobaltochelatase subunit CobN [Lederbergia sp. NSJ-179]|uniref:cobaltochelatase subunit CobN n=1 Tax=Lederbergia sp. NSJ-179 TaxID=2931402 RepID=UPI001FD39AC8|nr:cobaltochelatase subunit CobN [Lederbergia sp. NSJ-179]MCJ7842334.1 cobaltochelatase subunit CobN [Lederbergia sp. NSJ-179]
MNITILTTSTTAITDLIHVYESKLSSAIKTIVDVQLFDIGSDKEEQMTKIKSSVSKTDILLLDLHGSSQRLNEIIMENIPSTSSFIVPINRFGDGLHSFFKLGSLSAKDFDQERHGRPSQIREESQSSEKRTDLQNYSKIVAYWRLAGVKNMRNLLCFLLKEYGQSFDVPSQALLQVPQAEPPEGIKETTIYDPINDLAFSSYEEYVQHTDFDDTKATVGFLFTNIHYPVRTIEAIAEIMARIKNFANVLPVAYARGSEQEMEKVRQYFLDSHQPRIDLLLNFVPFRLGAGPVGGNPELGKQLLEELNVPVLHPFFITRRMRKDWEESPQGVTAAEFSVSVMLPELDGNIETFPVGVMDTAEQNQEFDVDIKRLTLIEDRAEKLVSRVKQWLKLRKKANKQKKIALIGYNYPPGEANIFGGSFLDTFASLEMIVKQLHKEGYHAPMLTKVALQERFVEEKRINSPEWVTDNEQIDFIRYKANEKVVEWGQTSDTMMTDEGEFYIPGIIEGNIFIGLQPARDLQGDIEKSYHDKSLPPHRQYIAFYQWMKEVFQADVIIHVGTHGTLEFLAGKECGMSGDCYPDRLIQDIPHLYLYYTGNPAEAMIAKRRSHATLISYQSPPFQESELYGEFLPLELLINEYHEVERTNPMQAKELQDKLLKKAKELQFSVTEVEELEMELYRIKTSLIPMGLHVFGTAYTNKQAREYMKSVLRFDRGELKSLPRLVAESKQLNYDRVMADKNPEEGTKLYEAADQLIETYLQEQSLPRSISNEWREKFLESLEFGMTAYTASQHNQELDHLIKALNGEFIPVRLAGDMIRDPAVFPTGYNLYQFDPHLVPSESAYERGKIVAEKTIEKHLNKTGQYPDKIGVVLWGLETSRTQGETLGQILHYLGIKVIHQPGMLKQTYEIIPIDELGRPRIDVVLNISGMFRAMFANVIEDLSDLFIRISTQNETDDENFMKRHTKQILEQLRSEGIDHKSAIELSSARMFGPSENEYGTNVTNLIETKNWEKEAQIGQSFFDNMQYIYTKNYYGKPMKALLTSHLEKVEVISQIRSTVEHEVVDLDHFYEFFGGLSKSVENIKGKKADVYISDTTTSQIETEDVEHAIARGIRTRITNPKWIEAMLEHDHHGVQKIKDRFENILGLAATTNKVADWIFHQLHTTYMENKEIKTKCIKNNRWAYLHMVETLLESAQRGYWEPTEQELNTLRNTYLELEGDMEETTI